MTDPGSDPGVDTAPTGTISVAVVDDQRLFCSGMAMLIESQPDFTFAGSALDGRSGVELVVRTHPDIVLMDIRMPELDGIEATRVLVEHFSARDQAAPKVIVLTTFQRDAAVVRAIQAGASGFIMKDTTPEFIIASIRTVYEGHSVIAPSDTLAMLQGIPVVSTPQSRADEALHPLSVREREVYLLAAKGLSNADIASSAYIGENTVKTHVRSVLAKLGLQSRVQIVAHAYENGLMGRR